MKFITTSLLALALFASAGVAQAISDAKRCQDWSGNLQTETGTAFSSEEECLTYAKGAAKLFSPTASNSSTNVGSFGNATLTGSGWHRNEQLLAGLFFAGGYELGFYRPTTDARGNFSLDWTWYLDCATIPAIFGTPPYPAYFAVREHDLNEDGPSLHAITPEFTVC